MESVQVPFHFASTFLVTIAAAGGLLISVRRPQFRPVRRLARLSFIGGWALLLIGEVVHGSLIAPGELDSSAVALRAGAYAFLVYSLMPGRGWTEARAVAASGSQALMPTFLAFVASFLAFRSSLAGARRLAAAFALFATSEVLFGLGGAQTSTADVLWFVAHGARLAGGLAVGVWLWEAFRISIQIRFIAAFVALLMLVVIALSSAMTQVFASNVRGNALDQSADEGRDQKEALDGRRNELIRVSKQVADLPGVRQEVSRKSPGLQDSARAQEPGRIFDELDFLAFFDASGRILAMSDKSPEGGNHLGEAERIGLAGTGVVQVALGEKIEAGSIDAIGTTTLAVVSAAPVFNPPGVDPPGAPLGLAGAVAAGVLIDRDYLLTLAGETLDFSVITPRGVLASTLVDPRGLLEADLRPVFERGRLINVEETLGQESFFSSYIPLVRTDNQIVGALVVSRPSEVLALTQRNVGRTLFAVALLAAALGVLSSYLTGARITRPIVDLTGAARRVREGDLGARARVEAADEVGALGETFNEMVGSIGKLTGDLRSAATQLETILQSLTDGVVAIDERAQVVAFNREAERIVGKSEPEVRGRRIDEVLVATDGSGSPIALPVYGLKRGSVSAAFISADGSDSSTPVAITSAPIHGEGGDVVGAVAVVRDLSSEIALEKAKTEFLSNISHELNTPLTPIKGYAEMLRRKPVARHKAIAMLDGIITSTHRLERIVHMLIDVSSMEAGRLTVRRQPLDLGKVTGELVDRWKRQARKHRFERRGFRNLPQVSMDSRLIPRAIEELIDNAVKFSPKGGRISIVAETGRSGSRRSLRISVADQGIGISDEQLATVFDEFTQADASETRAYGGLGLGLAYVRRVVDAHGGSLEVKSTPGNGSRFSIILPADPERRQSQGHAASTKRRRRPISNPKR